MRVLELVGFEGPSSLRLGTRDLPHPRPNEFRIRLRAAAINHLDVFITHGRPKRTLPAILGMDGAGVIEAAGADVDPSRIGEDVIIYPLIACGRCEQCLAGSEVHCPERAILGEQIDGLLCEAVCVPARNALPRPAHLRWEEAAALPLAWLTAWRVLFTRGALRAGDTLVVVGAGGGVANAAIILALSAGLRVFATSRDETKRKAALALGVEAVFASDGFSRPVREATGGRGVRAVLDTVGQPTIEESVRALAREGMVLTVGATAGAAVTLPLARMWYNHHSLITSTMGTYAEFLALLDAVRSHSLRPSIDRVYPLAEGRAAFERMDAGEQFGKIVCVP